MNTITLHPDHPLRPAEILAIASTNATVELSEATLQLLEKSHRFLAEQAKTDRLIYGLNTGFGPLATERLCPEESNLHQKNLVYHLATGVGESFDIPTTRAIMVVRLQTLSLGYSGVSPTVARTLTACLNQHIHPVIPSMGTVGASGDLTPLAHVALALIGEGEVHHQGKTRPSIDALEEAEIAPLELKQKEALALVNGTAAMTAVALLNGHDFQQLLDHALRLSATTAEVFQANQEAYDPRIGKLRPHPGQCTVHARLSTLLKGASRLKSETVLQDSYSLRCLPQLFGAMTDVLHHHDETVSRELYSVSDNPLVLADESTILHGGNFFGQHIAFASDSLAPAIIQCAAHSERLIARLTDPRENPTNAPYLTGAKPGLNSGLMGAQVTATALLAEMRSSFLPVSCQTIPTNGGNQDIVPLGTIAARKARSLLALLAKVLAIESIAVAQALDLIGLDQGFSPASLQLHQEVRRTIPTLREDRPLSTDIEKLAKELLSPRI